MPDFVNPGFRFRFDPLTDTVETHMAMRSASGETRWEITHQTTGTIFLDGEREYIRCADEIRLHRLRTSVVRFPRRRR